MADVNGTTMMAINPYFGASPMSIQERIAGRQKAMMVLRGPNLEGGTRPRTSPAAAVPAEEASNHLPKVDAAGWEGVRGEGWCLTKPGQLL